jgi:hypothetical protein
VLPPIGLIRIGFRRRASISAKLIVLTSAGALLAFTGCGPIVSLPLDTANYIMLVNSTSGTYCQSGLLRYGKRSFWLTNGPPITQNRS